MLNNSDIIPIYGLQRSVVNRPIEADGQDNFNAILTDI